MLSAIVSIENVDEREILDRLYRTYYAVMMRHVIQIVHTATTAEDIIADAVLSLFDKAYLLESLNRYECAAYMVRAAERRAYKYNKAAWSQKVTLILDDKDHYIPEPTTIGPEELLLFRERKQAVAAALLKLSERDRLLLEFYYFDEMSHKEIAKLMQISESNVKKYLYVARRRALPLLKEVLHSDG